MTRRKFKTEILVRDNRLPNMQDDGLKVDWKKLSDEEFELELRRKLIEEATEASKAKKSDELAEELADVLEVVESLMKLKGISREYVEAAKSKKSDKIGGFNDRIYTYSVEMDEDNPSVEYYLKHKEKYPEIGN